MGRMNPQPNMIASQSGKAMRRRLRGAAAGALLLALLLALLPTLQPALAAPPQRVTLDYEMARNGIVMIEVSETLEQDGKTYRINSSAKGRGLLALTNRGNIKRSSVGAIGPQGLKPSEFRDERSGRPASIARFDWAGKKLLLENDGRQEARPLPDNAQDRLSFAYNFAFSALPQKQVGAAITDGKGIAESQYIVAGEERITTPAGEFETLHLVRKGEKNDNGTELWLASKRHMLPVRILVIEKDGTRIEQSATRVVDQ